MASMIEKSGTLNGVKHAFATGTDEIPPHMLSTHTLDRLCHATNIQMMTAGVTERLGVKDEELGQRQRSHKPWG